MGAGNGHGIPGLSTSRHLVNLVSDTISIAKERLDSFNQTLILSPSNLRLFKRGRWKSLHFKVNSLVLYHIIESKRTHAHDRSLNTLTSCLALTTTKVVFTSPSWLQSKYQPNIKTITSAPSEHNPSLRKQKSHNSHSTPPPFASPISNPRTRNISLTNTKLPITISYIPIPNSQSQQHAHLQQQKNNIQT